MKLLDRSRPFATLFDGERQIQCYYQDKRMFDKGTGEELDLDSIAKKAKEPPALVCKFCRAKRQTPELMQEHLVARHSEDMVEADAKARAATEAKEEADIKVEAQAKANAEAGAKEKEDAERTEPETETKGGGTEEKVTIDSESVGSVEDVLGPTESVPEPEPKATAAAGTKRKTAKKKG